MWGFTLRGESLHKIEQKRGRKEKPTKIRQERGYKWQLLFIH
jgi:hypothetical protein